MATSTTAAHNPGTCADDPPTDLVKIEAITSRYPGFTRDFLMKQIEAGRLCAYKVGGRWFIGEADFAAFVAAGRNVGPTTTRLA